MTESELDKLEKYLKENLIEYKRVTQSLSNRLIEIGYQPIQQIIVYENGERVWDAVCGYGTYGWYKGLLEVMGEKVVFPSDNDSVVGWLTAEDVIKRLEGGA